MNDLIDYLEDKDDDNIIENIKILLSEKRTAKKKHIVFQSLSASVSDMIMGPPANKCMNAEEKTQYNNIMEDLMQDGTWDDAKVFKDKGKTHGLKL